MIEVLLNIGLNWADTDGTERQHTPFTVGFELFRAGIEAGRFEVLQSDTEPTLIVEARVHPSLYDVRLVADALSQDCIAVWRVDEADGALVGAKAADWGPFDRSRFLTFDGPLLQGA